MKSRPILFSPPIVRALLDGRKTQTRRIVKPQPDMSKALANLADCQRVSGMDMAGAVPGVGPYGIGMTCCTPDGLKPFGYTEPNIRCKYGKPGDQLWVRERTRVFDFPGNHDLEVIYEADGSRAIVPWPDRIKEPERGHCLSMGCYREASRITLEITGIRCERLQEISEEDAKAEGATRRDFKNAINGLDGYGWSMDWSRVGTPNKYATNGNILCEGDISLSSARWAFCNYIDTINGPGSWEVNPWVWVVEFKRLA